MSGQIKSARGMPFFLATASPSFSALTTCCGLAGATGATKAVLLESIISGRRNRPRITSKAVEGCRSTMDVFLVTLFQPNGSPVACEGWESVLASVLLDASSIFSRNFFSTRHSTRVLEAHESRAAPPSYHCFTIL